MISSSKFLLHFNEPGFLEVVVVVVVVVTGGFMPYGRIDRWKFNIGKHFEILTFSFDCCSQQGWSGC